MCTYIFKYNISICVCICIYKHMYIQIEIKKIDRVKSKTCLYVFFPRGYHTHHETYKLKF